MTTIYEDHSTLTVAEMAALYRVSQQTIRRCASELGGLRIGRQWRFPEQDITASTLDNRRSGYGNPTSERLR